MMQSVPGVPVKRVDLKLAVGCWAGHSLHSVKFNKIRHTRGESEKEGRQDPILADLPHKATWRISGRHAVMT
eukprot:6482592-Amphidinium_carterae.1